MIEISKPNTTQDYIIRQSSLKAAVDVCVAQNKTYINDVLELAEKFEKWVKRP
jgi:hypothetical protein